MQTPDDIIGLMKKPSVADLALVHKAFEFAAAAHEEHKRYSGEPYLNHLAETAKILAELGMDATTVAAGLLHDTLEDAGVRSETLKREFSQEILMLVEGVTNLGHLHYRGIDRYRESLRRMFIASAMDVRVLIIKLADRLHNIRTLQHVPQEKRGRIALETLEIYAPIAHRLGIRRINRELQELAFPFAYSSEFARVKDLLKDRESDLTRKLQKFHRSFLKEMARQDIQFLRTEHRIKGLFSLYVKLKSREWDLEKIYDVLAIRVFVKEIEDCYRVLGAIHGAWRPLPRRIKDYIAFPKPNGYQSLHTTVFTGDGGIVEFQIRTEKMHRESEYGVAVHFEYKEKMRSETDTSYLAWAKRFLSALVSWGGKNAEKREDRTVRTAQNGAETPRWVQDLGTLGGALEEKEFWTRLQDDFFKYRVFVFTPKGDVVDLPAQSSPIDFAYAIHSDIGDHLSGTKVNGKLVAIDTPLKNGDIVEILTRTGAHPTPKWLEFTKTAIAKKHIRATLLKLGVSV